MAALLAIASTTGSDAQDDATAGVELRILQSVTDSRSISVGALAVGDSWEVAKRTSLRLDDGFSSTGRYRYGDIALEVPLLSGVYVTVEARVWQDVENGRTIYVSARPAGGSWKTVGTPRLPLDQELEGVRYGVLVMQVPVPGSNALEVCSGGVVIPEPEDNPGLVQDCLALFKSGPILAGSGRGWHGRWEKARTNWRADVPLSEWVGVTVSGAPARVTALAVPSRWSGGSNVLSGRIPPELGQLSKLEVLDLSDHHDLTGEIPPSLGNCRA